MADWTQRVLGGDDEVLDQATAINDVEGWASKDRGVREDRRGPGG